VTVPVAGHAVPPPRRGSSLALGLLAVLLLATLAVLAHARWGGAAGQARMAQGRTLVQALQLTDLAWFTEARYTRHLSQSDLHSAFQDAPGAMEHFPAGSLLSPPQRLLQAGAPAGFMEGPPR
jgi:hypothetical protein